MLHGGNPAALPPASSLVLSTPALTPAPRARRALRVSCLAAFAGSLLLAGCRDAGLALGGSNAGAKARAEEVFIGFASRYLNVHHGAKYDYARTRLADAALVPSRAFDDTAVWTASPAPTLRVLRIGEHTTPAGVHEEDAAVDVPWPYRMGDAVHTVALSRLPGKGEYAWDTDVNFALGAVHADDVGDAVAAVFAAAEGRSEPQLLADYRGAVPHSADVLGQLFSIDTIHPSHLPDGSTLLTLWIGLHPEGLTAHYPVFWEYMAKYVRSTRYQLSLSDPAGAEYFTIGTTGQKRR